ncbi:hypothetical protein GYA27_03885 [candidate division WWE3 bacterium]|uniref:Uncharacterized protein n=1 Tax=candidate division WWE3 bacterium TaxID=2053526 RepID=A0A7X9HI73_UNCKA|nr:hypothetical protein [candidate division WWE3 bacterium]
MLLTPHALVGIAIASTVPEIPIAVPVSFVMHFMGDLVPHWDFYTHTTREQKLNGWRPIAVMADLVIGVATGTFFTLYALWVLKNPYLAANIFLSAIASVLPDVLTGPALYMDKAPLPFRWMYAIQKRMQFPAELPWGIFTQVVVAVFCLGLILGSLTL